MALNGQEGPGSAGRLVKRMREGERGGTRGREGAKIYIKRRTDEEDARQGRVV